MKRLPVFVLCVAAALGLSALVWPRAESAPTAAQPLVCLVGGTMTPVFNELAWAYEKQAKQKVEITSADSGELLASIEMQLQGDLYVAHDPFMDIAMRRGLGVNAWCVAELVPVMIVQKGNPRNIHSLRDLLRPDVRGYLLPIIFRHAHVDFDELNRIKQIPTHRSGSWVANQIILDSADVALVWQVVAQLRQKDLDVIPIDGVLPIPGVDAITSATGNRYLVAPVKVAMVTLTCSQRPRDAEAFVKFVGSEQGQRILRAHGYRTASWCGRRFYANGVRVAE